MNSSWNSSKIWPVIRKSAADLIVIGAAALIISLSKLTVIRKQSLQLSRADILLFLFYNYHSGEEIKILSSLF